MEKLILIPARYGSSRFPGKPLAKINGKEMILHVCGGCSKTGYDMYVVTDDERISNVVTNAGYKSLIIEGDYITGSDRVSEAAKIFNHEIIINVQGDEPLVDYRDIIKLAEKCESREGYLVFNMYTQSNYEENDNTIKVVTYKKRLLYMSRSKIPFKGTVIKKQVGMYAFPRSVLREFYGKNSFESPSEIMEGVEILRALDFYGDVFMIETKNNYQAVDTPEDIKKVEDILNGI